MKKSLIVYSLQIIKKLEIVRSVVVVSGRGLIFVRVVGLSVKTTGLVKVLVGLSVLVCGDLE